MGKGEYHLERSFMCDNGELDGLTPQQIFVLGYEMCQVGEMIDSISAASKPVHSRNQDRIRQWCEKSGRKYTLTYMPDDPSEDWMLFRVEEICEQN